MKDYYGLLGVLLYATRDRRGHSAVRVPKVSNASQILLCSAAMKFINKVNIGGVGSFQLKGASSMLGCSEKLTTHYFKDIYKDE